MTNRRKQTKEKKAEEMNFFGIKASFVAGIVLIITIFKDIAELFISIPIWGVCCYSIVCLLIFYFVLGTKIFDNMLKTKGIEKVGSYLTITSVVIFLIENIILKFLETYGKTEAIITIIVIGITVVAGALYLLNEK